MSLLDFFRAGTRRLTPFETAILGKVEELLPDQARDHWQRRIAAVNLVQRHDGAREINLYETRRGKVVVRIDTALIDTNGSTDFAEVETRSIEHPPSRLRATIGLVDGILFCIEFDAPSEHADLSEISEMRARLLGPPFHDAAADQHDGWPV